MVGDVIRKHGSRNNMHVNAVVQNQDPVTYQNHRQLSEINKTILEIYYLIYLVQQQTFGFQINTNKCKVYSLNRNGNPIRIVIY